MLHYTSDDHEVCTDYTDRLLHANMSSINLNKHMGVHHDHLCLLNGIPFPPRLADAHISKSRLGQCQWLDRKAYGMLGRPTAGIAFKAFAIELHPLKLHPGKGVRYIFLERRRHLWQLI